MAYGHPSPPTQTQWVPQGDLGTYTTLLAMRAAVNASLATPLLLQTALSIVGAAPKSAATRLSLIRNWLVQHTQFQADSVPAQALGLSPDADVVRTPVAQLQTISESGMMPGDCDDVAVLGAALAKALAIPVRFVVLAFKRPGVPFQHVYAQGWTGQCWQEFTDITRTPFTMAATRRAAMVV